MPPQIASRVEHTCLNRGHSQTEPPSGFRTRKPLQFLKKNYAPQVLPEARNCLKESSLQFVFRYKLFRPRMLIRWIESQRCLDVIIVTIRKWYECSPLPEEHQGFIDSNTCHPS